MEDVQSDWNAVGVDNEFQRRAESLFDTITALKETQDGGGGDEDGGKSEFMVTPLISTSTSPAAIHPDFPNHPPSVLPSAEATVASLSRTTKYVSTIALSRRPIGS